MRKIYMAILVSTLCFVFMDVDSLWAQKGFIYEVTLNEQVNISFHILEGKVIDQKCFWNKERNLILTAHTVEVYKTFKGEAGPFIEVLTLGGSIDGNSLRVSSELNLRTGDMGVFMLKKAKEENLNTTNESFSGQFEVVSAEQGFYRYNLAENKVSNPFSVRTDIENDFYEEIKSLTDGHVKEYKNFELEGFRSAEKLKNAASIAIESFSPNVTTAGTQSVVQIKGTGFGTDKGTVGFRYANDGGASFYDALASEIVSWTDTEIEVQVPTYAGTGTILVVNTNKESVESTDNLSITYAITNTILEGLAIPTQLIDQNGQGGYLWHMHTDFNANGPAKEAFTRAMNNWICASKVKWQMGLPTSNDKTTNDGECVIRFDNGDELPMGVLGRCLSYSFICEGPPIIDAIIEIDMIVDDGTDWNFGETPSEDQYDFETVVLHELGHGLQLRHVMESKDVMFYGLDAGQVKRTLSENDITGANFVQEKSSTTPICIFSVITDMDCPVTGIDREGLKEDFTFYPSPASSVLYFESPNGVNVKKALVLDMSGRLLITKEHDNQKVGSVELHALPKGTYILNLITDGNSLSKQFVVE